jgi:hypothetical protein
MNKFDEMTFEQFKDNFEPIQNFIDDDAGMDGILFDIYGQELDYIKEESSSGTVWTLIQKHNDKYILEGFHITNRAGYIITAITNTNINTKLKVIFETKTENQTSQTSQKSQNNQPNKKSSWWSKLQGVFR